MVETESDEILRNADIEDVALLVVGDPFGYVPGRCALCLETETPTTERQPIPISSSAPVRRKFPCG